MTEPEPNFEWRAHPPTHTDWKIKEPDPWLTVTFPGQTVLVRLWYVITNVVRYIVKGEVRL